jgi:hypothetical protein
MFNHPPGESFQGDLAKQMAKLQLIEQLQDETFTILRQTRTGLLSYPTDLDEAKGQLASSMMLQMALNPQIIHVVAFCEADHAAKPLDIIQSCKITRRVIKNCLDGIPDMTQDPVVIEKSKRLAEESNIILQAIKKIAKPNIILNERYARGEVATEIIDGICRAIDSKTGNIFSEKERISRIFEKIKSR